MTDKFYENEGTVPETYTVLPEVAPLWPFSEIVHDFAS